jgi:signal transduction histidine kinase
LSSSARPASEVPFRNVVLFAGAAVGFAFALIALPGPRRDPAEIGIAVGLAAAVVGLAALRRAAPAVGRLGPPLVYVALVAVLIDGSGGTSSGFGGLFLLPLLWLAIVGSRRELVLAFAAVAVARVLPVRVIGTPEYPSAEWRSAIVLGAVAVIASLTIQQLVREARARAAELRDRAAELEQAARRLETQNTQLRELDRVKDDFVALVSHELRTPLTSIAGYLEMVLDDGAEPLTHDQRQFLDTVGRNVDRLATLVDELLFLAQVDAGRLELSLTQVDVNAILEEAVAAARPVAAANDVRLVLDADQLAPVICDRGRIAQVVDNLVSNAVKFTRPGGRVDVAAVQEDGAVALTVRDTGIGIPEAELPRIFNRFFRASSATRNAIPGTGLGLAISQAIAEAHGSRITVESARDQGTAFRLRLASVAASAATATPARDAVLTG